MCRFEFVIHIFEHFTPTNEENDERGLFYDLIV